MRGEALGGPSWRPGHRGPAVGFGVQQTPGVAVALGGLDRPVATACGGVEMLKTTGWPDDGGSRLTPERGIRVLHRAPSQLHDNRTGAVYRTGPDGRPSLPHDVAYLGRLARPDGKGTFLAIAGIHPQGSLGVAHLLASDISTLWGQAGEGRFSVVAGTDYERRTHEP